MRCVGIFRACTALGLMLTVTLPARSDDTVGNFPLAKQCLAATETVELKDCVQKLAKIIDGYNDLSQLFRGALTACAAKATLDEMRPCIEKLAAPPASEKADRADSAALKKALRTWEVQRDASRMDSSARVFLTLESDDEVTIAL